MSSGMGPNTASLTINGTGGQGGGVGNGFNFGVDVENNSPTHSRDLGRYDQCEFKQSRESSVLDMH